MWRENLAWTIEFDAVALKQLQKLSQPTQLQILAYLKSLLKKSDNPQIFGKPLLNEKRGLWRYRVNKYRIICKIEKVKCLIIVVKIGKRDKVYE